MKKLMIAMLLTLTLCLSACTTAPQTNRPSEPARSEPEQAAPVTTPIAPEDEPADKTNVEDQEPAPVDPVKDEEAAVIHQEPADEPAAEVPSRDVDSADVTEVDDTQLPQPEAGESKEERTEETESEQIQEAVQTPAVSDLNKDDILVDFQGEFVEVADIFRMYSVMWTRTEDSYYAISPDAVFTVTNNGTDENAYLVVSVAEWIRSAESFVSVVNHDGELLEMDMLGEFWSDEAILMLSDRPAELSAGYNLYWSEAVWGINGEKPYSIKLSPGESVTFRLPERREEVIYNLSVKYQNDTEEFGLPGRSFLVTAADVTTPSATVAP